MSDIEEDIEEEPEEEEEEGDEGEESVLSEGEEEEPEEEDIGDIQLLAGSTSSVEPQPSEFETFVPFAQAFNPGQSPAFMPSSQLPISLGPSSQPEAIIEPSQQFIQPQPEPVIEPSVAPFIQPQPVIAPPQQFIPYQPQPFIPSSQQFIPSSQQFIPSSQQFISYQPPVASSTQQFIPPSQPQPFISYQPSIVQEQVYTPTKPIPPDRLESVDMKLRADILNVINNRDRTKRGEVFSRILANKTTNGLDYLPSDEAVLNTFMA